MQSGWWSTQFSEQTQFKYLTFSQTYSEMIAQHNAQAVVYNINNTHGNNYVNHAIAAPTTAATMTECAQVHAQRQNDVCAQPLSLQEAKKIVTKLSDTSLNDA